jgi:outer membrane receptor for monomeric catechols
VANTGSTFAQRVEGYELNLTANPARNWRLQANFSFTDGYVTESAPEVQAWAAAALPYFRRFDPGIVTASGNRTIAQVLAEFEDYHEEQRGNVGLALAGNRAFKTNLFTTYSFSEGRLKGFRIGGGYRHFSKLPIGRYPDQTLQYGPSYWDSSVMLGYRFARSPLSWVRGLNLQLNVNNALNEDDALVFRRVQGTTPEVVRRIRVREPRTWRLAANFDF